MPAPKIDFDNDPGFQFELEFWNREIVNRSDPELREREFPRWLMPYVEEVQHRTGRLPKALDVGSGPLSMLAWGAERNYFELTCVDPLADKYLALMRANDVEPNAELIACFGEDLAERFPPETFDLVWMCNALDHSQDPGRVFREMTGLIKPGGYLAVLGYTREGSAENFLGLHQHDLYLDRKGRLMCETRVQGEGRLPDVRRIDAKLPIRPRYHNMPTNEVKGWMQILYQKAPVRWLDRLWFRVRRKRVG